MISCTEFIPAYSELFKFLESKGGKRRLCLEYWEYLSDTGLDNLRDQAEKIGLEGCFNYWSRTLNEEAADFTMTLNALTNQNSRLKCITALPKADWLNISIWNRITTTACIVMYCTEGFWSRWDMSLVLIFQNAQMLNVH